MSGLGQQIIIGTPTAIYVEAGSTKFINFELTHEVQLAPLGTITGKISYSGTKSGALHYAALVKEFIDDLKEFKDDLIDVLINKYNPSMVGVVGTTTLTGPATLTYSLRVPPITYYIAAFLDIDKDEVLSIGDPVGIYGTLTKVEIFEEEEPKQGQLSGTPTPVNVELGSVTSTIDFELSHVAQPPPFGTITGSISYFDEKKGILYYFVYDNPQFKGIPVAEGFASFTDPAITEVDFTIEVMSGTYYMAAFIDADDKLGPTAGDLFGIYGELNSVREGEFGELAQIDGTPTAIHVEADSTTHIEFELTHKVQPR